MRHLSVALCLLAATVALGCSTPPDAEPEAAPPAAPAAPSIVGKAARGTVVTLEPATPREFPLPEGPAVMDQYAKQFVPDLLLVRVGQPVEFRNSEDSPHNVNVNRIPTGAEVFSVATAPYQKHVHTFDQPGQYAVACDIHPGMLATVVAATTPYVTVVDATGTFVFADLTPGEYLVRWAGATTGEKKVTLAAGATNVAVP